MGGAGGRDDTSLAAPAFPEMTAAVPAAVFPEADATSGQRAMTSRPSAHGVCTLTPVVGEGSFFAAGAPVSGSGLHRTEQATAWWMVIIPLCRILCVCVCVCVSA